MPRKQVGCAPRRLAGVTLALWMAPCALAQGPASDRARFDELISRHIQTVQSDPQTGLAESAEALSIAERLDDPDRIMHALFARSGALRISGRNNDALSVIERGLALAEAHDSDRDRCRLYQSRASVEHGTGALTQSVDTAKLALAACKRYGSNSAYSATHNNLALTFSALGDHRRAAEMLEEAIAKKDDLLGTGDAPWGPLHEAQTRSQLGIFYSELGDYAAGIAQIERSLEICEENDIAVGIVINSMNLGEAHILNGAYDDAERHLNRADEVARQLDAGADLFASIRNVAGDLAEARGDDERAIALWEEALAFVEETDGGTSLREYRILTKIAKSRATVGDGDAAVETFERAMEVQRSVFDETRAEAVGAVQAELESSRKDQEIAQLTYDQELRDFRLSRQRQMLTGGGFLVVLLTLAAFAVAWLWVRRGRSNRELAFVNAELDRILLQREELVQEVHHRIKNNLQTVLGLLQLQAGRAGVRGDVSAATALEDVASRIEAMALLHGQLQENGASVTVAMAPFLKDLANNLSALYRDQVSIETDLREAELDTVRALPIGLIVTELVSNAVRHAFPVPEREPVVTLTLSRGDQGLQIEVADNGRGGLTKGGESAPGVGLGLVRALAHQAGGRVVIESPEGKGTTVTLSLIDPPEADRSALAEG